MKSPLEYCISANYPQLVRGPRISRDAALRGRGRCGITGFFYKSATAVTSCSTHVSPSRTPTESARGPRASMGSGGGRGVGRGRPAGRRLEHS